MSKWWAVAPVVFLVGGMSTLRPVGVTPTVKAKVTYAKEVAPILNEKCVSCHRPGQVAPFSLIGYDNAKKWAGMISQVTSTRQMPPWKAVAGFGEFHDENRLADDQIKLLKGWAEAGAPRGDRTSEPKSPKFASDSWMLGKPDMILSASRPYRLVAEGNDVYRNFVVKTDSKEPIWVTGMDVLPGNRKIVHHVIVFVDGQRQADRVLAANKDDQEGYTTDGGGSGFLPTGSLGGWAPGLVPHLTAAGTAFKVPPGANLVLQVHYHPNGKAEEDLTRVGLYLAKEPPKKEMLLNWIFNFNVNIPAGEKNYKLERTLRLPADVTVYAAMPHMHLLGRTMKAWFELPDGTTKPLVFIDDWDFNWQFMYGLREPLHLPKGTKVVVQATYDNSAENLRNPNNPPKRVTWGEQTTDEMFLMIMAYTVD